MCAPVACRSGVLAPARQEPAASTNDLCASVLRRRAEALVGYGHQTWQPPVLVLESRLISCITCCAEPLKDYVGPIGLYGHVNDILKENMSQMKVGGRQCYASTTSVAVPTHAMVGPQSDLSVVHSARMVTYHKEVFSGTSSVWRMAGLSCIKRYHSAIYT